MKLHKFVISGAFCSVALAASIGLYYLLKKVKKTKQGAHQIIVVETIEVLTEALQRLLSDVSASKVVGFDCEWVSTDQGSGHVALVQLASTEFCILVRLCKFTEMPLELHQLLADKAILKVGVGCQNDARKLSDNFGAVVKRCLDLRALATNLEAAEFGDYSLSRLARHFLNVELDKRRDVRCSNWEADKLTSEQVEYAAMDALVATRIYHALIQRAFGELNSNDNVWQEARILAASLIDIDLNATSSNTTRKVVKHSQRTSSNSSSKNKDESSVLRAYHGRKTPLYHNSILQAPNGQVLCTCDSKKAYWYVSKKLGVKVQNDPLIVRLTFDPAGRPLSDRDYYLQEKQNVCVVCGKADSYIRKNIVPHEYRKYFPAIMKDHRSHDVVLLCIPCHRRSCLADTQLKQSLLAQCADNQSSFVAKYALIDSINKVRSAAKALRKDRNVGQLPEERRKKLENTIMDYYGLPDIDDAILEMAMNADPKVENSDFVPEGQRVVEHVIQNGGLVEFETMWRRHFIDTMQPQFLPVLWSVDHGHDKLAKISSNSLEL
jgi:hypothetical protein